MANMTFAQSVEAGRSQGRVSHSKAMENYKQTQRKIDSAVPRQAASSSSTIATKTSKSFPDQQAQQERTSYLRGLDLDAARSRLSELETAEDTRRAIGNNMAQVNRFLPGSATWQRLQDESKAAQEERDRLRQDIAAAEFIQISDRYQAMKSAPNYHSNLKRNGIEPWKLDDSAAWATEEEADTFYYIRNTQGEEAALDYLRFMGDEWNYRSAQVDAESIQRVKNPVAKALSTGAYGFAAGLDQFRSGVAQTAASLSGDVLPTSSFQQASAMLRDDLSGVGRVAYDVLNTTGNMVPSIVAGAIAGPAGALVGSGTMASGVFGNSYNSARKQGYSDAQAKGYASITAASEALLQYFLGGIGALGGKVTNSVVQRSVQNIRAAAGRVAAELGLRMGAEFTEEYLQETLDPVFRNLMLDEKNKFKLVSQEQAYAGLLGALSAGLLEGGGVVASNLTNRTAQPNVTQPDQTPSVAQPTIQNPGEAETQATVPSTLPTLSQNATLQTALVEYRNTGVTTNRVAEMVLSDPEALRELNITPDGRTRSQQRAMVKQAIAQAIAPRAQVMPMPVHSEVDAPVATGYNFNQEETQKGVNEDEAHTVDDGGRTTGISTLQRTAYRGTGAGTVRGDSSGVSEVGGVHSDSAGKESGRGIAPQDEAAIRSDRELSHTVTSAVPTVPWVQGHTTPPADGTDIKAEVDLAAAYGIPAFVVDSVTWDKFAPRTRSGAAAPAFSENGQIYFRDTIPQRARGTYARHELTHVMKQVGFEPYLDFIQCVPQKINLSSKAAQRAINALAQHRGISLSTATASDARNLWDELASSVYGVCADPNSVPQEIRDMFYDFDAFIGEMEDIHRQFRESKQASSAIGFGVSTPSLTISLEQDGAPGTAPTQFRYQEQTFTEQDYEAMPDAADDRHRIIREQESLSRARAKLSDIDAEIRRDSASGQALLERTMQGLDTNRIWTAAENDLAYSIFDRMMTRARETGDYTASYGGYTIAEWRRVIRDKGTAEAQALQARRKWSASDRDSVFNEATDIVSDSELSTEEQAGVIRDVDQFMREIEEVPGRHRADEHTHGSQNASFIEDSPESREALVGIIERIAQHRGITRTVLSGKLNGLHSFIRKSMLKMDASVLEDYATRSALAVANDMVTPDHGEMLKTLQVLSHLFNPKTWFRNVVGNTAFATADATALGAASLFDILLAKRTGTRSVVVGPQPFSKETISAKEAAFWQSVCAVYLDVDLTGEINRYGQKKSRTFRMGGTKTGALTRFMSKLERNLSYALTSTDQMAKGGVQATQTARIQRMLDSGVIDPNRIGDISPGEYADQRGADLARYRTFQDNSKMAAVSKTAHDALNLMGIGNSGRQINGHTVHSFGLGDLLNPYPGVPGNIASRAAEYSPVAFVNGIVNVTKAFKAGKTATVAQQASAVMQLSRGLTGSAMIGLAALAAAKGLLRSSADDEDKDVDKLNRSEGLNGIQINISGMVRMLAGESTEWQKDDRLASLDFLQPINSWLALGCFVNSYLKGDQEYDALTASIDAFGSSIEDFPVLQTIQDIVDDVRYNDTGLLSAVLQESASSAITSVVPSLVRNVATASDPYQRDLYSGEFGAVSLYDWISQNTGIQSAFLSGLADFLDGTMKLSSSVSSVMNAVPGVRYLLPQKLDNYGQPMNYTGNRGLDVANALFLPGSINTYRQRDVSRELASVASASGVSNFYPNRNPVSTVEYEGEKHVLTYAQRQEYQKNYGLLYDDMASFLIQSDEYKAADAATRVDMFSMLESIASAQAKVNYMESVGIDYSGSDAAKLIARVNLFSEAGIYFPMYYTLKAGISEIDESTSSTKLVDKLNLLNNSGLDIQQQATVYYHMVTSMDSKKINEASKAGVGSSALELWGYRFKLLDELNNSDNAQKRRLLFSTSGLSSAQKQALDEILINDGIYIPKDVTVDYSDENAFYVSQMSDAGKRRYNSFVNGQLSGEEWSRIYSNYSSMNKADIISGLVSEGWSRTDATTIYYWIKPTQSMKRSAGWEN